jgi:hypothetical protein
MRIEVELLSHPKFLRLKKGVGQRALTSLVYLWGHCQSNMRGEVWRVKGDPATYVERTCHWTGKPRALYSALVQAGFIEPPPTEKGKTLRIHDWEQWNSRMIASWRNGQRGGRKPKPKEIQDKKPVDSPTETQGNPTEPLGLKNKPKETQPPSIPPSIPIGIDGGTEGGTGVCGASAPPGTHESASPAASSPSKVVNGVWPTMEEAVEIGEMRGVRREVTEKWWLEFDARGGRDRYGKPLRRWLSSLLAFAQGWRATDLGKKAGEPGVWALQKQIEATQKLIDEHKGNPDSGYSDSVREDAAEDYRELVGRLKGLREKLATANT